MTFWQEGWGGWKESRSEGEGGGEAGEEVVAWN